MLLTDLQRFKFVGDECQAYDRGRIATMSFCHVKFTLSRPAAVELVGLVSSLWVWLWVSSAGGFEIRPLQIVLRDPEASQQLVVLETNGDVWNGGIFHRHRQQEFARCGRSAGCQRRWGPAPSEDGAAGCNAGFGGGSCRNHRVCPRPAPRPSTRLETISR